MPEEIRHMRSGQALDELFQPRADARQAGYPRKEGKEDFWPHAGFVPFLLESELGPSYRARLPGQTPG